MNPWAGVALLEAVLLVVLTITAMRDRHWLTKIAIARHVPDLIALDRKPKPTPPPSQEPVMRPTKLSETAS